MSVDLPSGWKPASLPPTERSIKDGMLLFLCTCGVYGAYWTYRVHEEHPRRAGDPTGFQAMLHMFLPCVFGMPLLIESKVHPEVAREVGMLAVWWIAMLLMTYANLAYAYIGWRLTGRFYEMWLLRDAEKAAKIKEGAFSLIVAIGIWVSRNLLDGLHESGVFVPGIFLHPATQAILRGLSIGYAFRWWLDIQRAANEFSKSPFQGISSSSAQDDGSDMPGSIAPLTSVPPPDPSEDEL